MDLSRALAWLSRSIQRRTLTPGALKLMRSVDHPLAASLANAIDKALSGEATLEEQKWIDAIEGMRGRICASSEPLRLPDMEDPESGKFEETTVGVRAKVCSKAPHWCLILFHLLRELKPERCLELGTCLGVSASYQAAAIELNGKGHLTTLEGQPDSSKWAEKHLESLELTCVDFVTGRFQETLGGVIDEFAPFDYVFIDGHHDEEATQAYAGQLADHLTHPALIVFDDIDWSEGMRRAWQKLLRDPRVAVSVDLHKVGLTIVDPDAPKRFRFRIACW